MEEKTLKISNGELTFDYVCTKTIHTKVSEQILIQLKYKDRVNPAQVVLDVIVEELGLGEGDWQLVL